MIRRLSVLTLALFVLAFATPIVLAASDRVALVIGNGAYLNATKLANPINDSVDVAQALRRIGFDVIEGRDLDKRGMEAKIVEFGNKLDRAKIALFFYAGHGMQVSGKNYLVPIDAKLERAGNLNFETIDVDSVLAQMDAEQRASLVFLDACRDNPLARSFARSLGATRSGAVGRGLAPVQGAVGTMIAYATQPDRVALDGTGRNSPFTTALLKHVATPGLEIRSMMTRVRADVLSFTSNQQVPWDHSSLIGEIVLVPGTGPTAISVAPATEEIAWSLIKDSKDPDTLRAFIAQYPNSTRRGEAVARLLALEQTKVAALPTTTSPANSAATLNESPKLLHGHTSDVTSVVFSADGTAIASASNNGLVMLWDATKGASLKSWQTEARAAATDYASVALSRDGRWIAAGGGPVLKPTIKLWDTRSGRLVRTFAGDGSELSTYNAVALSPDGRLLAAGGSAGNAIRIWTTSNGQFVRTLAASYVRAIVFSPDGRWLASGHQNNTARLWDVETGQLRHTFTGHNSDVYAVAFSPDGRRVATGSSDRLIKLWDVDTGQLVQTFEGHGHTVSSVAFSPDGRTLASGSFDTTMKLWEVDTGQLMRTIENDRKWIYYSLAFSPDGQQLASANSDKTIRIWPLESGKRTVIDFDALNAFGNNAGIGDRQLADYLARFGIKVTGNTSPRIAVFDERNVYEGKAIKASSGRGVLMQQGGNPVAYTLEFAIPLKSISFNRVALIAGPSGITHPVWKAVAQDTNGKTLAEAGETTISSYTNLPPRTFSLTGPGIKRLVVTGDHKGFAAFSSVVLDNLVLTTD